LKTVWKFDFEITDRFEIAMPKYAGVLHVGLQHDKPRMWALVDPHADKITRKFRVFGTGHAIPDEELTFIGTFLSHGDNLVWHIFEENQ